MLLQIKHYILILLILLFYSGCANKNEEEIDSSLESFPEIEYIEAKKLLDNEQFDEAFRSFSSIEKKYPLSNWALKSKIMLIFINYLKMNYEEAELDIKRFINKYPDYKDIEYVYYLRGLISYEQIKNPGLDAKYTEQSLEYFEELIRRFPNSKYSKDGKQKIILINTVLAGKDMHVGYYYLKQEKYLAALNRYRKVVDNYETNRYTPEALHRIVEIYYTLGMIEDAKKIAAVLGYNYPESTWYKDSFELVGGAEYETNNDKSWANKLLKKIF